MKFTKHLACVVAALMASSLFWAAGCGDAVTANGDAGQKSGSGLPNERFHRPAKLEVALPRLRQLHDAIVAEGELPAPIVIKVAELVHGTGASAHSHFHLAGEYDGHHEEGEEEKIHQYEVDAIQELEDIVGWLPRIAGSSDLKEKQWKRLKELSTAFESDIEAAFGSATDLQEKRKAYRSIDKKSNDHIEAIEKLVAESLEKLG